MKPTPADNADAPEPRERGPEELVDAPRENGETIRTVQARPLADGSGNDSPDTAERPDDDTERHDAG